MEVLGSHQARRLSIISFRIRHGTRYLHHNFVVAVLHDLFGIQARGDLTPRATVPLARKPSPG